MPRHLDRANLLYNQRRFDLAIDAINEHLRAFPDDYQGHALLALCLERRNQSNAAESEARTAVRLGANNPHPHYVLAFVLRASNKLAESENSIKEAIRLEPENVSYIALLINLFHLKGRLVDALTILEEAQKIEPNDPELLRQKMYLLQDLGDERAAKGIMNQALSISPEESQLHAAKGWSEIQTNRISTAVDDFKEALRLNPVDDYAKKGLLKSSYKRFWLYRAMDKIGISEPIFSVVIIPLLITAFYLAENTPEKGLPIGMVERLLIWNVIGLMSCFIFLQTLIFATSRTLTDRYLYTKTDFLFFKAAMLIVPFVIAAIYGAISGNQEFLHFAIISSTVIFTLINTFVRRKPINSRILLGSRMLLVVGVISWLIADRLNLQITKFNFEIISSVLLLSASLIAIAITILQAD